MTASEFEKEIRRLESALEAAREDAEQACQEFITVAAAEIADWIPRSVKDIAERQHAIAKTMDMTKLASLKRETESIASSAAEVLGSEVGVDQLWPHRADFRPLGEGLDWKYKYRVFEKNPHRGPEPLENAIRDTIVSQRLLPLIKKYGFAPMKLGRGESYGAHFNWTPNMFAALRAYGERLAALDNTREQLEELRDRKGRSEAGALWDKA